MAYQIDRYNNTLLTVVEDGTIDRTTDLKFIGKNYAGYGEIQNENFLFLLENFNGANPPPRAVSGQTWFDSSQSKLKLYNGSQWKTTGGAEVSDTEPTGLAVGDFWWDSGNDQLYVFNGTNFVLVGPQGAGDGITQMRSLVVKDLAGNDKYIIAATINTANVIFVISADDFTLNSSTPITGFDRIRQGITLVNTTNVTNGITSSNHRFWGTASNAEKLNGASGDDFVTQTNPNFINQITTSDSGISIGEGLDLNIYIQNNDEGVIENSTGSGSEIILKVTDLAGTIVPVFTTTYQGITPIADNQISLGSVSKTFSSVHAASFVGEASQATSLKVGSQYFTGSLSGTANTVAARDSSGDLYAQTFVGVSIEAFEADLAEKYTCDETIPVGSVVYVCAEEEHDICVTVSHSDYPMGVVSSKPAIIMNKDSSGLPIALCGRVPVRVTGPVTKGDRVYSCGNGCATVNNDFPYMVGIALETSDISSEKMVECAVNIR